MGVNEHSKGFLRDLRLISFYCYRGPYLGFRINIIYLGESMGLVII
jgi:hypothetical protein